MDTNKKIQKKEILINKFKKTMTQLEHSVLWVSLKSEDLSLEDWENLTDYDSLGIKIRHSVYSQMKEKAQKSLRGKDLVMIMIKLTSISDPEYYPDDDDFTPYYDEIFNHKISVDEMVTVFLHTTYSFDLFTQIYKDFKYAEIQEKLCGLIIESNPRFEDLSILNDYGIFYLFKNTEERLKKYYMSIEEAIKYARLEILEKELEEGIHEDNLVESVTDCAESSIISLYFKFKELAEEEDGMDNALDDAKFILNS